MDKLQRNLDKIMDDRRLGRIERSDLLIAEFDKAFPVPAPKAPEKTPAQNLAEYRAARKAAR
jgi:hypothetical protein